MTTLAPAPAPPVVLTRLATPFRIWLVLEFLFGAIGFQAVFLHPQDTATNFAWTIDPSISAAVLGACYLATAVMLVGTAFATGWEEVRAVVVGAATVTSLLLVATLLHWDVFAVGTPRFVVWLVSYLLPPPLLAGVYAWQQRRAVPIGAWPTDPLPTGFRLLCLVNGAALVGAGAVLFGAPGLLVGHGPWALTPLTIRVLAAWGIGVGVLLVAVAADGDRLRARFALLLPAVLGPALAFQLVRFGDQVDAADPGLWVVVADLLVLGALTGRLWLRHLEVGRLAGVAAVGAAGFLAALVAMPLLRPDLDPLARWVAEYARGPFGWVMVVAYVGLAVAVWSLAAALARTGGFGRIGPALLAVAGIGALVAAVLPQDPTTPDAAVTAVGTVRQLVLVPVFLSLFGALFLITRRFRGRPGFAAFHLPGLVLAVVSVAALAVTFVADPSWRGMATRVYDIAWTTWLLVAAVRLRRADR